MIVMLHCLGVPDEVFLEMQKRAKEYASVGQILGRLQKKSERMQKVFKLKQGTV
jgi:hypothetical protein